MAEPVSLSRQIEGWIERLRAGDEAARKQLINCSCERLTQLTRKMLRDYPGVRRWEQTDDVLQSATMRLYRTLEQVTPASARDYFRLAALNIRRELIDLSRHHYGPHGDGAHHASVHDQDDSKSGEQLPQAPEDSANEPARLAQWTEFHRQVEALPEEERAVFDLLWYQELSQAEAADVLRVSERTIKRRWQSARQRLHEALGGEMPK